MTYFMSLIRQIFKILSFNSLISAVCSLMLTFAQLLFSFSC